MKRNESIWRKFKVVAMAVAFWLAMYGHVFAAKKAKVVEKTEGSSQSWVFPYFVVMMAVGLGMLVVCRSSRRAERAKPKQYESLNTTE
jgi:hypothetical protein